MGWGAGGTPAAQFSHPLATPLPADIPFEGVHNVEQIVLGDPPPTGEYLVEISGGRFRGNAFNQFPGQPFALVILGSGQEIPPGGLAGGPIPIY